MIKLFFKGVLLYVTFIFCMLVAMGIDDIYDKGYFIEAIVIAAVLIFACRVSITGEEFSILSLDKLFKKYNL